MKYIKTYENVGPDWVQNHYKFYWIIPLDDRLDDSVAEIVESLNKQYYGNKEYNNDKVKNILQMIESYKKNMLYGILTYNSISGDWDISDYNQEEINDCEFRNYNFKGLVNIDEAELEIYKDANKYNL